MKDFCLLGLVALLLAVSCVQEQYEPALCGTNGEIKPMAVSVRGINVEPRRLDLYIGQTKQLTATVYPADAGDKRVRWTQSVGVASVDQNGNVRGLAAGNASVTAHSLDGDYQSTARIFVTKNAVASVRIEHSGDIILTKGEIFDLKALAIGEDPSAAPSYPSLRWSSTVPDVASIDPETGRVRAKAAGEALIEATSVNDTGKKAACKVTVLDAGPACEGGVGFKHWDF